MMSAQLSQGFFEIMNKSVPGTEDATLAPTLQVVAFKVLGKEKYKLTVSDGRDTSVAMASVSSFGSHVLQVNDIIRVNSYFFRVLDGQSTRVLVITDADFLSQPAGGVNNALYDGRSDLQSPLKPPPYANQGGYGQAASGAPSNGQYQPPQYSNENALPQQQQPPSYQQQQPPSYQQQQPPSYQQQQPPSYQQQPPSYQQPSYQQQQQQYSGYGNNGPTPAAGYPGQTDSYNYGASGAQPSRGPVVVDRAAAPPTAVTPISALNPYTNSRWTVKARVSKKTDIKSWKNSKGEGTLFSIDIIDTSGEIRGTFFKETCSKFFPIVEQGKVYYFSGGKLKVVTNPQFSSLKNNYEITFDNNSEIRLCDDDKNIGLAKFNFVKIEQLESIDVGATVDVIGWVRNVNELSTIITKAKQESLAKRDVTIVDDSNVEVRVTLWGSQAQQATPEAWQDNIVALKGARVGEYQGKNLSTMNSTTILINPDIDEGRLLDQWRRNPDVHTQFKSISAGANDRSKPADLMERKTISYIKDNMEALGRSDKGEYVSIKGTLNFIKHDQEPWYTACPYEGCKKKVIEISQDMWRCEKCNKEYPGPLRLYIMPVTITDHSGSQWMSCFNEIGEKLMGETAENVHMNKSEGSPMADQLFADALFKTYILTVRMKMEPVNDEMRLKCTIHRAHSLDFAEESKQLIDAISKY